MTADPPNLPLAIIGAGFSGTMVTLQFLEACSSSRTVLLCERAETFGRGLAYATGNPAHLLNVRAANMSAYPDRPSHFEEWLTRIAPDRSADEQTGIYQTPAGTFVARGLYGRYLTSLLTDAVTGRQASALSLIHDTVIDLEPASGGLLLRTLGGLSRRVAGAVIATGNLASATAPASRHCISPWYTDGFDQLDPKKPVLVIGTGLTMVDTVAALRSRDFRGPVLAISRRGLLPNEHASSKPWPVPKIDRADLHSLSTLLAIVRAEVAVARSAGANWRGVLDALRPVTDSLWNDMPASERARFLRHLRPFWDVHRHRTAPPAAASISSEIERGSLIVRSGRIVAITDEPAHALVTWRRRGTNREATLRVQRIFDASGFGSVAGTRDALLRRLMERGMVQPGPFGLGLDAGADFRLRVPLSSAPLWTIGPLMRGVMWECTAVPDIRSAAAELAAVIIKELDYEN